MLKKKANHVSPRMHKEVELHAINGDNNRSKVQQANRQFLIAKRLLADLPLVPTNNLVYSIVDDMQVGLYDDLGDIASCDKNWDEWLNRTAELMRAEGYLLSVDARIHKPCMEVKASKKIAADENTRRFIKGMFDEDEVSDETIDSLDNENTRRFIKEMFDEDEVLDEAIDSLDDETLNKINDKAWQDASDYTKERIDADGLSDETALNKIQYIDIFGNKYPELLKEYITEASKKEVTASNDVDITEIEASYNIGESNGCYVAHIDYGIKVNTDTPEEEAEKLRAMSVNDLIDYLGKDEIYAQFVNLSDKMEGECSGWYSTDEDKIKDSIYIDSIKETQDGVDVWLGFYAFSDYIH